MRLFSRVRDHRFCAFCKSKRRVYVKKHIDLTNVLITFFLAVVAASAFSQGLDPVSVLLWSVLLVLTEIFVFLRWRIAIVCRLCGFDPVLYKKSPALAAQKVRQFFDENVRKPQFFLSRSPLLETYRRQQELERKKAEYAFLMQKQKKPAAPTEAPGLPPRAPTKGLTVSRTV